MSWSYNFPACDKFMGRAQQIAWIQDEAREVIEALNESPERLLEEVLDLHHALETLERNLAEPVELSNMRDKVVDKNTVREYYARTKN